MDPVKNKEKEKEMQADLKRRYIIFFLILVIFCGIILRQLVDLQIVNGKEYLDTSTKRIATSGVIYANRGNIYDRNGIPIAGNRMGFCVQYVDTKLSNGEKNAAIARLIDLFNKNGDKYHSTMNKIFSFTSMDFLINREGFINQISISDEDKSFLMEAEPKEVFKYMREKTFGIDAQYTDEEAYRIMELRYEMLINYCTISDPLLIAEDVSIDTVIALEERNEEFSGFTTYSKPFREYYDAHLVAHVLGYIGSIGDEFEEWSKKYPRLGYLPNDKVGICGIERSEEHVLRGINGVTRKEVDIEGRLTYYEVVEPPVPGQDIYLTIDLNLQKATYESIERNIELIRNREHKKNFHDANAAAVVAMDVKSGEILAMVSYPAFDPADFLEGNNEKISYILNHPDRLIFNRATSGNYAPGSTYKPLIAIAALESGIITPSQRIDCPYTKTIGGLVWRNPEGNQGRIVLEKALATSSNMYFFQIGFATGIDNIVKWAKNFGFGKKTGIEIGESIGAIASREYKQVYIKESWVPADTCNASIGQLYNAFTPIQLVNYVATIGNGGRLYRPHLVRKRMDASGQVHFTEIEYQLTTAKESTIKAVQKGMVAVANSEDGTAVNIFKDFRPIIGEVAGKTGTAETGQEATSSSNALFVCYAPADDPEIAVAVVVEKGVSGAWSAPIARDVLMAYFNIQDQSN
jgi:penicillin-binding protein 2